MAACQRVLSKFWQSNTGAQGAQQRKIVTYSCLLLQHCFDFRGRSPGGHLQRDMLDHSFQHCIAALSLLNEIWTALCHPWSRYCAKHMTGQNSSS